MLKYNNSQMCECIEPTLQYLKDMTHTEENFQQLQFY